ncbi:MAG TPA: cytochrome c peroxidase [Polyangiaceae bacterium]|nr:cytochrome c peroxidase [Polyangiaceae bacterium]
MNAPRFAWVAALSLSCGSSAAPPRADALPARDAAKERSLIDAMAPPGFPQGPVIQAAPDDSPLTEAGARLGRRLFYDRRLSRGGEVACASCHVQEHAFSDPRPVSVGVLGRTGTRNAPILVNLAWSHVFFWDGRATTLEEQVGMPIENPLEMDLPIATAVSLVGDDASYQAAFLNAFGAPPSELLLRRALASFVRTLVSGGSRYDRFAAGDASALSGAERRGEAIFFGEQGQCFHCHPPGATTNDGLFNDGTYRDGGDTGRQGITMRQGDLARFKVPGLRNVAVSAPYMHDGSLPTLEAVVEQYDAGGQGHSSTDPLIGPLHLSSEAKADMVAFLKTMTDEAFLSDARLGAP